MNDEDFLRIIDATPLVSIDLILRDAEGRLLLGRRVNRPAQHSWFVPGGRIRKNERLLDALQRIALAETGLALRPEDVDLLGVFDHLYPDNFLGEPGISTHYVVVAYTSLISNPEAVRSDDQHSDFRWWQREEALGSDAVHENTKAYLRPDTSQSLSEDGSGTER